MRLTTLRASASFFFFNDPATTEIYTLSLHDALPILHVGAAYDRQDVQLARAHAVQGHVERVVGRDVRKFACVDHRLEEHTSELQSRLHVVCRLLLENKKRDLLTPIFDANAVIDVLMR